MQMCDDKRWPTVGNNCVVDRDRNDDDEEDATSNGEFKNYDTMPNDLGPKSTSLMNDSTSDRHQGSAQANGVQKSISSMISFSSSIDGDGEPARPYEFLGHKVEMVYSLLTMLTSHDRRESSQNFLTMSQDLESSQLMRQSGCLTLLIQLLHNGDVTSSVPTAEDLDVINRASQALRNMVRFQKDEARQRRESKILRPLEQIRAYVVRLRVDRVNPASLRNISMQEVNPAMAVLMKFSFDEEDRHVTSTLGGLQAIAETLIMDQFVFGLKCEPENLTLRRYIGMTLTNLTFGAAQSKQILCSYPKFLEMLNYQIEAPLEDVRSVFASVLRNLSWKADVNSKYALRNVSACTVLIKAAMRAEKESTLKSILSALWNLSAHCSENKLEICSVPGALEFLLSTLSYDCVSPQNTSIVENGSGILRNISSHVAQNDEFRDVLRRNNCFQILLRHLQSSSLTIVSNSCGALWNLSARDVKDQKLLCDMGAVPMLRNLVNSKHKMISLGSSATLKNLLSSTGDHRRTMADVAGDYGCSPTTSSTNAVLMKARKSRTLECEIDENLSDVCGFGVPPTSSSSVNPTRDFFNFATKQQQRAHQESSSKSNRNHSSTYAHSQMAPTYLYQTQFSSSSNAADVMKSSSLSTCSSTADRKVEQFQQDRSTMQRFHNSLRRSQRKDSPYNDNGDETVRSYCVEDSLPAQSSSHSVRFCEPSSSSTRVTNNESNFNPFAKPPYEECISSEVVKSYAYEGTPAQMSQGSSLSDLRSLIDKDTDSTTLKQIVSVVAHRHDSSKSMVATMDEKSKSSSLVTSARDSKVGTAMQTPMMYSRHSSLQSLDSCEQQSVRSTVYSEYSQLPTRGTSPSDLPDSPTQSIRQEPIGIEDVADYRAIVESALPKPKAKPNKNVVAVPASSIQHTSPDLSSYISSQHRGKNVAIAKPIVRPNANVVPYQPSSVPSATLFYNKSDIAPVVVDEEQEDVRIYATEPTPGASLRSSYNNLYAKSTFKDDSVSGKMRGSPCASLSKQSTAAPSPKASHSFDYSEVVDGGVDHNQQSSSSSYRVRERTDVEECIYSALPKPKSRKSKSLDRKSHNRFAVAANNSKTNQNETSNDDDDLDSTMKAMDINSSSTATTNEKGILEMSDISLVDSIADWPSSSRNDDELLKASTCSNLVKTVSTCEKVKDAASLTTRCSPTKKQQSIFYPPPSPLHVVASSSSTTMVHGKSSSDETNESLSEDNYSRIEDEQFDVAPDDDIEFDMTNVDGSSSSSNQLVVHFESDEATLDALLSAQEVLIDCDRLSFKSNTTSDSLINFCQSSSVHDSKQQRSPKVLTKEQSVSEASLRESKKIKGSKKLIGKQSETAMNSTFAAPKLAVRTTKTVELRAKRASETSERLRTLSGGSRSASPSTPRKWGSSPRTSDAELESGRFSRNTFERRSRQSTSSGEVNVSSSPNNVSSWPRALSNFNFVVDKSSPASIKNCTVPFLKVDLAPASSQKTKPAVPPKPSKFGRQSPFSSNVIGDERTAPPAPATSTKKSFGKNVGSKIASLWKKDDVYNAEASAESQASDDGNLASTTTNNSFNNRKLSKTNKFDDHDIKHQADSFAPTSCIVQPFSYIPKSPKLRNGANFKETQNSSSIGDQLKSQRANNCSNDKNSKNLHDSKKCPNGNEKTTKNSSKDVETASANRLRVTTV